jgi:hypothetical protein
VLDFFGGFLEWWKAVTSGTSTTVEWWNSVVSGVVIVALGIPSGLSLDKLVSRPRTRKEKLGLISTLIGAVDKNLALVNQINSSIRTSILYFSVDVVVLDAVAGTTHERLGADLARKIDYVRYELTHLSRKLDRAFVPSTDPNNQARGLAHSTLSFPIQDHASRLIPALLELQQLLANEKASTEITLARQLYHFLRLKLHLLPKQ